MPYQKIMDNPERPPEQKEFQILECAEVFQGYFKMLRYLVRHQLFNGQWGKTRKLELFERGDAVAVLPYDPVTDQVILIEQFRIGALRSPIGPWLLEIVAGVIDEGETPEEVAMREAIEESNCEIQSLLPISDYLVSPGGTSERIHLYCGKVDTSNAGGIHGLDDEGEDIKVHVFTFEEAMSLLKTGRINSASPIMALQWLALNHDKIQNHWNQS